MSGARCECGRLDDCGGPCSETLDLRRAVRVAWVPESQRGSAEASGTWAAGAYAEEAWITPQCLSRWARDWLADMGDFGCVREHGAAWLRKHNRAKYDHHLSGLVAEASR